LVASRQGGGTPWRDETQERIGSHRRLNPADRSTDFRIGLKPLKTRPTPPAPSRAAPNPLFGAAEDATRRRGNGSDSDDAPRRDRRQRRQEGHGVLRSVPAVRKGKPLKGEPHECRRCETEPAGFRGEQGVRRLRKPEGAAQPGQVSPVLVAPRHLMRCRGEKPQESVSGATSAVSAAGARTDGPTRVKLWSSAKSMRGFVVSLSVCDDLGAAGRPRRPTSREAKVKEESSTNRAIPRSLAILCRTRKLQERRRPSR
jgi:hypothetical protein